jgi:hypothetical protein
LAGADFMVVSTENIKTLLAEAQVHEDTPEGKAVGIPKRGQAIAWGPGSGWVGVAWQPGEVPLEPGKTYCIQWRSQGKARYRGGIVNNPANAYANGMAFLDGTPQPDADLEMTLIEYSQPAPTTTQPAPYTPTNANLMMNGDFEQGQPTQDAKDIVGWTRWESAPTTWWYGPYGRNKSQAIRAVGGSINGTKMDGGLVQRIDGLSAAKTYRLSGWVTSNMPSDMQFLAAIGCDPTGQTTDSTAPTIVWEPGVRECERFDQVVIQDIHPNSGSVSVWLRAANKTAEQIVFTSFDDLVLEETTP